MPLFYFDSDDGERFTKDRSGVDLIGLEQAVQEALGLLRDLADHELCIGQRTLAAIVRDTTGQPVYRATMTMTGVLIASREASGGDGLGRLVA